MALDEKDFIQRYLAPLTEDAPGAVGLGDDLALITVGPDILITSDTIIENIHYLAQDPPASIARKLLRVNLSDLAAKGGRPLGYVLNAAFNRKIGEAWIADFVAGLKSDQAEYDVSLWGGDTTVHDGAQVFSVTMVGQARDKVIPRRSGAQVGDVIAVTGCIGEAVLGLALLKGDLHIEDSRLQNHLIRRYREPEPRLKFGQELIASGIVNASMDLSDGLLGDLLCLMKASSCGARIALEDIPLAEGFADWRERLLVGGDDYELLITLAENRWEEAKRLADEAKTSLTAIGYVTEGNELLLRDGQPLPVNLNNAGYRHVFK